jgi:hypothetical protein
MSANRILSSTVLQPKIAFGATFRLDAMIALR